jgi:hypothetical protein
MGWSATEEEEEDGYFVREERILDIKITVF